MENREVSANTCVQARNCIKRRKAHFMLYNAPGITDLMK
ncbi:hypothetical protein X975_00213, partial [Stegodyphus mimosarum]